jgi:hypothetical protein
MSLEDDIAHWSMPAKVARFLPAKDTASVALSQGDVSPDTVAAKLESRPSNFTLSSNLQEATVTTHRGPAEISISSRRRVLFIVILMHVLALPFAHLCMQIEQAQVELASVPSAPPTTHEPALVAWGWPARMPRNATAAVAALPWSDEGKTMMAATFKGWKAYLHDAVKLAVRPDLVMINNPELIFLDTSFSF